MYVKLKNFNFYNIMTSNLITKTGLTIFQRIKGHLDSILIRPI